MPGLVTITTPAAASALTTAATLADMVQVDAVANAAALAELIRRASGVIAAHCARVFGVESVSEVFRADDRTGLSPFLQRVAPFGTPIDAARRPLVMSRWPVVALSSVTDANGLVDPANYEVDRDAGLLHRLFGTSRGVWAAAPITLAYSAGYNLPGATPVVGAPALPPDIEDAAITLAAAAWNSRGRDLSVALDVAEGVGRTQFFDRGATAMRVDSDLAARLAPYSVVVW